MNFWKKRSDVDRREEMQGHLRIETDRLVEQGFSPTEARARALDAFGYASQLDPAHTPTIPWTQALTTDARLALRRLGRSPISTGVILMSLIIGIGVNTAIFSLTDQVLVRALPVESPSELVQLEWEGEWVGQGRGFGSLLPHPLYLDLRSDQRVFSDVFARSTGEANLASTGSPEKVEVELVTGGYFPTLGVKPTLGRLFTDDDDRLPDAHPVLVLSHAYWLTRLGGDSSIVGKQLQMNGRSMTVVGVAAPEFHGTDWSVVPAVWVPMMMNDLVHEWGRLSERRVRFQHVYARLNPGVNAAQAEAALLPWFRRYVEADMAKSDWPTGVEPATQLQYLASRLAVRPGSQGQAALAGQIQQPILILAAATALLLLLACLNVANLSMARAVASQRDTAMRGVLGATRSRIMAERFVESALLAGVGGILGVAAAPTFGRWVLSYLQAQGGADLAISAALDGRALVVAMLAGGLATVLAGVGPAWFSASARPATVLKAHSRTSTGGLGIRRALVVGQVAMALVFLVGAGLFMSTLGSLRGQGPGFATEGLLTFTVAATDDGPQSKEDIRRLLDATRGLPGVSTSGVSAWPMLTGSGWNNPFVVGGIQRSTTGYSLPMNAISPGFFETLGVPVVLGRDFDSRDVNPTPGWALRSAIVSEAFVDEFLPGEHPIGVRISAGSDLTRAPTIEIVGVVQGYQEHGLREAMPQVFVPLWERSAGAGTYYLRGRASFDDMAAEIRKAVAEVAPALTLTSLRTFDTQIDSLLVSERMLASLAAAFAFFATLLAMIGVYGVLSFSAQCRTKEIGIRLALGAPQRAAGGLILGEAVRLTIFGVIMALPVAWALGRLVENQLFGVTAVDPGATGRAVVTLTVVCLVAGAIPAWRMLFVDPVQACRAD